MENLLGCLVCHQALQSLQQKRFALDSQRGATRVAWYTTYLTWQMYQRRGTGVGQCLGLHHRRIGPKDVKRHRRTCGYYGVGLKIVSRQTIGITRRSADWFHRHVARGEGWIADCEDRTFKIHQDTGSHRDSTAMSIHDRWLACV